MMKTKNTNQRNVSRRLSVWAIIVVVILLIPYIAKAPWTAGDFIFAAVVLFGLATVYELVTRNMSSRVHRIVVGAVVLIVLVLVQAWAVAGP